VVRDAPWSFIPSKHISMVSNTRPTSGRTSSSSKQQLVFTDMSSTTYAVITKNRIPISIPSGHLDLGLSQSLIPESLGSNSLLASLSSQSTPLVSDQLSCYSDNSASVSLHPITLLPQSTSTLIHIPHQTSTTRSCCISMMQIHLMQTYHSISYAESLQSQPPSSLQVSDYNQLLLDVTQSYYDLAVLSKVRYGLDNISGLQQGLPFHLEAVDAILKALGKDWEKLNTDEES